MATKTRKRSRNSEQEYLPGTAPEKNDRVHRAARRYVKLRDARMAANEEEKAAHTSLLETMIEERLESYEYGDLSVHIDSTRKCKVKLEAKSPSDNGDGKGEDE